MEELIKELDAAKLAYDSAMMSNAHPSFLATLSAEERVRRDAWIRDVQERYRNAYDAYDRAVEARRTSSRPTLEED